MNKVSVEKVSIIIPVHSKEKLTSLSSTPEHPNGVMLASIVPPNEMAEALVHEWSHNVLNLAMNENKLILSLCFINTILYCKLSKVHYILIQDCDTLKSFYALLYQLQLQHLH